MSAQGSAAPPVLGAIRRLRLGSVSTDVLRAASGPVLISPHAGREAASSYRATTMKDLKGAPP